MVVKDAFKRMDGKKIYFIENGNKYTVAVADTINGENVIIDRQDFTRKTEAKKAFDAHKSKVVDAGEFENRIEVFLMKCVAGFLVLIDDNGTEKERKFYKTEKPARKAFEAYKNYSW